MKTKLCTERLAVVTGVYGRLLKRAIVSKFFRGDHATVFFTDKGDLARFKECTGDVEADNVPSAIAADFCDAAKARAGRTLAFCYDRAARRPAWSGATLVNSSEIRLKARKELLQLELGEQAPPQAVLDFLMVAFRGDPDEVFHFIRREAPTGKLLAVPEGAGLEPRFAAYDRLLKAGDRSTFMSMIELYGELVRGKAPEAIEAVQFARALYRRLAELKAGDPPKTEGGHARGPVDSYLAYRDHQVRALARTLTPLDLLSLREVTWASA